MNPLVLRVATRFAARPIPLDKAAVHQEAETLTKKLIDRLAYVPEGHPVGHGKLVESVFDLQLVRGDRVKVPIIVEAKPSGSTHRVLGGGMSPERVRTYDDEYLPVTRVIPHVWVFINGSKPRDEFTNETTIQGLEHDIYEELIHEFSHAAEAAFLYDSAESQRAEEGAASGRGTPEYYNLPTEVRAYMQQIVDDVTRLAALPILRKLLSAKAKTPHDLVMAYLDKSAKWKQVERHLNPQNKAKVLKAVYTALDESGLLPS